MTSFQSDSSMVESPMGLRALFRNFLHIPAYLGLSVLLMLTVVNLKTAVSSTRFKKAAIWSFILAVAFGILNEFIQAGVPGRFYSIGDMVLNAIGAGLGVGVLGLLKRMKDGG